MIKENQRLLNQLNMLSDALITFAMLPVAFWLRFYVLPGGVITVLLRRYLLMGALFVPVEFFTFLGFGLYQSFRKMRLRRELPRLWEACTLDLLLLLAGLFLRHWDHYSRETIAIFFLLNAGLLSAKRYVLRRTLRHFRAKGYNLKHVLLIGNGPKAKSYLKELRRDTELGYQAMGYVAACEAPDLDLPYLGSYDMLETILNRRRPDEVVSAIELGDYQRTPGIIAACERTGVKLSIVPFYSEYMSANPQFDDLNGIPLLNVRRIPLDNLANAFVKRSFDILLSALILILFSPLLLICAIGVKLSSPGPVIFKQERIGRKKKPFMMYKFRSMRVNDTEDTGWSGPSDARRTKFGAFIRKFSLDEFPQFWNVLIGDMSLVGPRPEVPYYVDMFKDEVPRYMLKHLVRPGITGWAQVCGLRGDTSIPERIRHDIYYIENWSLLFDLRILLITVFGGKFINNEQV